MTPAARLVLLRLFNWTRLVLPVIAAVLVWLPLMALEARSLPPVVLDRMLLVRVSVALTASPLRMLLPYARLYTAPPSAAPSSPKSWPSPPWTVLAARVLLLRVTEPSRLKRAPP